MRLFCLITTYTIVGVPNASYESNGNSVLVFLNSKILIQSRLTDSLVAMRIVIETTYRPCFQRYHSTVRENFRLRRGISRQLCLCWNQSRGCTLTKENLQISGLEFFRNLTVSEELQRYMLLFRSLSAQSIVLFSTVLLGCIARKMSTPETMTSQIFSNQAN